MPKSFFKQYKDSGELSKQLQKLDEHTQTSWELVSCVDESPGVVGSEEVLCRQVLHPVHIDNASGELKPSLFEDAANKGASVHRRGMITDDRIREILLARVDAANVNPPATGLREMVGYAHVQVSDLRAIVYEDGQGGRRRGVGVYDTSKADDVSHADICQLVSGKKANYAIKEKLYSLAKDNLVPLGNKKSL